MFEKQDAYDGGSSLAFATTTSGSIAAPLFKMHHILTAESSLELTLALGDVSLVAVVLTIDDEDVEFGLDLAFVKAIANWTTFNLSTKAGLLSKMTLVITASGRTTFRVGSVRLSATKPSAPTAPIDALTVKEREISWDAVSGAFGYNVYIGHGWAGFTVDTFFIADTDLSDASTDISIEACYG